MSSGRPPWKPKHFALGRRIFERTILPIAMTLVKFWIVEDRVWWGLSWWDLAQDLCVLFQQGIDHLGHLARNANQDLEFPAIGSFSLVIPAHPGNQALVEFGPFALLSLDRIGDDQEHGLLHRPCPRVSQLIAVEGRSALLSLWSPSKVGFEGGSVLKVEDIPDGCHDRSCLNGSDTRHRGKNLALTRLLDQFDDFHIQLLDVLLQHTEFAESIAAAPARGRVVERHPWFQWSGWPGAAVPPTGPCRDDC